MKDRVRRAAAFVRAHWGRLLAGAGLVVVFFGNGGFRSLTRNWLELRRLNAEIVALEREEKELEGRLRALRSGDGVVERLARRELGYIKKGEIEYRFPPPAKR
ncbi:MAG: septum formation initiator family protein [Elusimicrobia bacterium]|nr:septum formation initiator family protein [Elusimicrobiota bacterium]